LTGNALTVFPFDPGREPSLRCCRLPNLHVNKKSLPLLLSLRSEGLETAAPTWQGSGAGPSSPLGRTGKPSMKLDQIYTRSGDDGRTSLGDGTRMPKFHVRVAAYGSIDEANSVIGIALLHVDDTGIRDVLSHVQNDLFDLGGDLCRPEREHRKVEPLRISEQQVAWVEEEIDSLNAHLAPLDSFVLPGGSHAAAHLHHARTVMRRAERYMTEIAYQEPVNPAALRYANRLSDLLFVLARYLNQKGHADVLWRPGLHR
jgi:cob(I)alamin adenosyltransferase